MSIVIPLDGPTSSGKTSVGYLFAQKIGFHFVDSGAIYRVGAIAVLADKIPLDDEIKLANHFKLMRVRFEDIDEKQHTFYNDQDVTNALHDPEVTVVVPKIAAYELVRTEATMIQRQIAEVQNTVMAGRDIGSVIFPEAKLKFYLTADIQIRAQRRLKQMQEMIPDISYEEVLETMIERDKSDMIRHFSPLRIPEGAVVIDTSTLTTEETVNRMLQNFREVYGNDVGER